MNISYKWLKEYINTSLTPKEIAAALTSIGLETGGIEEKQSIKGGLEGLVIGKVLTCEDHPNSDHLHITTVHLGDGAPTPIVCGAANVAAGQHVVVATVGTTLYSGEESFTIKRSKIRGAESHGMICAEDEIGVGSSHEGIITLPADTAVGTPAKEYYRMESDFVLEVDITPNRVDAASHYGVARDLAAYLQQNRLPGKLHKPSVADFVVETPKQPITVEVKNSEAAPRYCGVTIQGVTVAESPAWLQERLKNIGLRPINNIVDITNYLLHETGQPLHCFDAKQIIGGNVVVTTLPEGTLFTTLDGVERKLNGNDLVIANAEGPMCLAGVFGGLNSGVTHETTEVFIESAYFSPTWVRKTARRHGLNTDSSFRFERGADPNNLIYVLKRAALLIKELAGGKIAGEIIDLYPSPILPITVELAYEKVNRVIGKEIPVEEVKSILRSLEIEIVSERSEGLSLAIPTYRVDVTRDVDVIEDILRIYGYNNIEISDSLQASLSYKTPTDEAHRLYNLIAEQLTGAGFNEIMNNSLTSAGYYEHLGTYPQGACVRLLNPLSNDLNVMRQTLLFGGLESLAYNINRRNGNLHFYEFGNCYYLTEANTSENLLACYKEEQHIGLWITGNSIAGNWAHGEEKSSVFHLKAHIINLLNRIGIDFDSLTCTQISNDIYRSALQLVMRNGQTLGYLGVVQPKLCKAQDIDVEVFFAELNWTLLAKAARKVKISCGEIAKFPPVKRDLALLIDKQVTFAEIEAIAYESERKLLKEVSLFDVYEGKNIDAVKKSYAVSFMLQDETKTLTDKQIESVMSKIINNLQQKLNAQLR